MSRTAPRRIALALTGAALALATVSPVAAADGDAMVRVLHASPDAPAVDVYVDDTEVLSDVPFKTLSDYLALPAGDYQVKVTAAGDAATVVIDAPVTVKADTKYTIAATNLLASIEPKILVDDANPTTSQSLVRVVHFSPDAGPVDVAPDGADALITNLEFPNDTGYAELAPGAYDLDVRAAGTDTVAIDLPEIELEAGRAYSVFAVGTAADQSLDVVIGVDAMAAPATDTVGATGSGASTTAWLVVALTAVVAFAGGARFATVRTRR